MATHLPGPTLGAPPGLVVETFERGGRRFALLGWPPPPPRLQVALRPAEREVFDLLVAGLSNAQIARRRGRSVRTVDHQVDSIFRRLGVHSRQELQALRVRGGR